ncbi:MAG TPA: CehA/McbA family metallohydrolase [bacterium]|nr:CehA/McbA family metallohydrolase [bacterium]
MPNKISFRFLCIFALLLFTSCSGSKGGHLFNSDGSLYPVTPFTITDDSQLIGGPVAQGRVGDVLLQNDRIRVIIQKPRKNAGVNSFGGHIIDADIVRKEGGAGQDNLGSLFPLVNIEWTVNNRNYEVISDGSDGSNKILRAYGIIDVYDYLDLDFIGDVAEAVAGQRISFPNRFDDRRNPFNIYEDLRKISREVVTDFILEPGKNYVRIEMTFRNDGDRDVKLPIGQFINDSGQISMLIPGVGFTPDLMTQLGSNTPAMIFAGFEGVDVSYGFFFDPSQFVNSETGDYLTTTSVSYSGVNGIIFGEEFLKLTPLGGGDPAINFTIPAGESRTVKSIFVVGDGSAGSVFDAGLAAIGVAARPITGSVVDSDGNPVEGATVAVMHKGSTLITYRTNSSGGFAGFLPTGGDSKSRLFGRGKYSIIVEYPGYHLNGTSDAGECSPGDIDLFAEAKAHVVCTLGETGTVEMTGPVIDDETGDAIPARLTIVGEDPSPNKVGSAGRFRSTIYWELTFGISGFKYIGVDGSFDLTGEKSFNIEPGIYRFVITHGPEYTSHEQVVEVSAGSKISLSNIVLSRATRTPGYIGADLHVHSIVSPDSNMPLELRVLSAAAEGIDVLQSTDHDFLLDYSDALSNAVKMGIVRADSIKVSVGDEVTPNHYGHLNVFPLLADPLDPEGGAVDWSASDRDEVSPSPDYGLSLDDLISRLREDPGEEVIQINHIMDNPTGLPLASGWVTTPFYMDTHGVAPLASYADPVERRMEPRSSGTSFPLEFGTSALVTTDFDAMELTIGPHQHDGDIFFKSALPTWFNMLNLGFQVTATASSDSHRSAANPMGLPRNYIASSVDPRDAIGGGYSDIDLEEYAISIKGGRVTVSCGPVVMMFAKNESGEKVSIGEKISGRDIEITVSVSAPSWAWFDTVEIYANSEPIPVDDDTGIPMQGSAADPADFYKPYHLPKYTYNTSRVFRLSDGTLENWSEEGGVINASLSFKMNFSEDSWVVALARGTRKTDGYRSLFPVVTNVLVKSGNEPEEFDPADLSSFHVDKKVGAVAWGLSNPIYVDVDGDGFQAKWKKYSPVSK